MKKYLPLAFLLLCTAVFGAEADHYQLTLTVHPDQGLVEGDVVISADGAAYPEDSALISLGLNQGQSPNPQVFGPLQEGGPDGFSPSGAEVTQLTVNGKPLPTTFMKASPNSQTYNLDRLYAQVKWEGEKKITVAFHYKAWFAHLKTQDDFYFENRMFSRFTWFPRLVRTVNADKQIYTSFTYHAAFTLDGEWELVPTGTDFHRDKNLFTLGSTAPVSTLPLLAVRGMKTYTRYLPEAKKTVSFLYDPENESRARLLFTYALDALDYYAKTYFVLDGAQIGLVQGNPGAYGMAADGAIILGSGLYGGAQLDAPGSLDRLVEYVVAHELGHFYFGIGTQQDFLRDNYLSEGLNDASTLLYLEQKYGKWENLFMETKDPLAQMIKISLESEWGKSFRSRKIHSVLTTHDLGWDDALTHDKITDGLFNASQNTDYEKPSFILPMLAAQCGTTTLELLKEVGQAYYHQSLTSSELQSFLEKRHQVSLGSFFDSYIRAPGWVDYDLEGQLNDSPGPGYTHHLEISDLQKNPVFTPTVLTLKLEGGGEQTVKVDKPGALDLHTDKKVEWAALDLDADALDMERKNNFLPRRVLFTERDPRLDAFCLDRLSIPQFVANAPASGYDLGLGIGMGDRRTYKWEVAPVWNTGGDGWGFLASYEKIFPQALTLNFISRTMTDAHYQDLGLGLTKTFYLEENLGQTSRYLIPFLSLTNQVALVKADWTDLSQARIQGTNTLAWDNIDKSGTALSVSGILSLAPDGQKREERMDLTLAQMWAGYRGWVVGTSGTLNLGFEQTDRLAVPQSALGYSQDGSVGHKSALNAELFLGIPLVNNIDMPVANLVILQSLEGGIFYQASQAWYGGTPSLTVQHAVGVGLVPVIRSLLDSTLGGMAFGASFDMNAIAAAPAQSSSYKPRLFIEYSTITGIFAKMAAY